MNIAIKNLVRIGVLYALLLIPIIYAVLTASDLSYSFLKKIAYLVVVFVCLLLPTLFLKARTYFIVEGIFNFLFFPIDIASLHLNHQSTSAPFLQNILNTDIQEAMELLYSIWPFCIGVVVLWIVYFVLAFHIKNQYLIGSKVRKIIIYLTLLGFIGGVGAMTILLKRFHNERTICNSVVDAIGLVEMKFYKIYPYNLYIHTSRLMQQKHRIMKLSEQVESFRFDIQPLSNLSDEMIILVIGEAARYDHFGINGYARNTTPRLSAMPNIVSFENVYTQANQTEYSVPIILTRANADSFELSYLEKSLPEAFQEAGFWSGYISKQVPSDIIGRIISNCNYSRVYPKDFDVDGNFDVQMIADIRTHTLDTAQFFTFHSLGSHFRYEHRYPSSFNIFMPILGQNASYAMISENHKKELINAYDNSILYTDFFLSELIEYVDSLDRSAVIVYISDHGESFWDDERKLSLHSSYQFSEAEFHIPLLIWFSDEYNELHPEKTASLQNNRSKYISSETVFYSMLDLAGIRDITDIERSICSPSLISIDSLCVRLGNGDIQIIATRDIQKYAQ